MDTGLRGFGPARPTQTASLSGSCPSGRGFASALPSDGASRSPPLRLASPLSPPDLGRGLAPPSCQACPAHPAVWKTRTRRSRLNAPPSRRVSHTALDGTKRRPHAPQARSLYSLNTTSRVGLVPRWRNRWEDTDRPTSLRSDERSTSPESVFQIPRNRCSTSAKYAQTPHDVRVAQKTIQIGLVQLPAACSHHRQYPTGAACEPAVSWTFTGDRVLAGGVSS